MQVPTFQSTGINVVNAADAAARQDSTPATTPAATQAAGSIVIPFPFTFRPRATSVFLSAALVLSHSSPLPDPFQPWRPALTALQNSFLFTLMKLCCTSCLVSSSVVKMNGPRKPAPVIQSQAWAVCRISRSPWKCAFHPPFHPPIHPPFHPPWTEAGDQLRLCNFHERPSTLCR